MVRGSMSRSPSGTSARRAGGPVGVAGGTWAGSCPSGSASVGPVGSTETRTHLIRRGARGEPAHGRQLDHTRLRIDSPAVAFISDEDKESRCRSETTRTSPGVVQKRRRIANLILVWSCREASRGPWRGAARVLCAGAGCARFGGSLTAERPGSAAASLLRATTHTGSDAWQPGEAHRGPPGGRHRATVATVPPRSA
jgi:hypothetical protein